MRTTPVGKLVHGPWLSVFLLLSCGGGGDGGGASARKERGAGSVLLRVGARSFRLSDFQSYVGKLGEGMKVAGSLGPKELTAILDQYAVSRIWLTAAEDEGLKPSAEEKTRLAGALGVDGALPDDDAMVYKYLSVHVSEKAAVSEQEVESYYAAHASEFAAPQQYHVKEILVDKPGLADQIWKELKAGGKSRFDSFARQFSIAPTSASGGDMGFFAKGELPPEFEKIVFSLKPGTVSEVVRTQYGYHVFYLEEVVRAHPQKLYEVKEEIAEALRRERERKLQADLLSEVCRKYRPTLDATALGFQLDKGVLNACIALEESHGN